MRSPTREPPSSDIQTRGAGEPHGGCRTGIGQRIQKQIGQTGIPVYNVTNACATGATAFRVARHGHQGRRGRHRPGGRASSRWARWACSARGRGGTRQPSSRSGRYGAVMPVEGILGTEPHARHVRPGRHGLRLPARRRRLRAVRQGGREEPRALDAESARAVPKAFTARRGHGRGDDRLPEHAAHVLPDRRRRGGGGAVLGERPARPAADVQRGGP